MFRTPDADSGTFGRYDVFDPDAIPMPGPFLADHDVLTGRDHLAFHRLTRAVFEDRGVYDVTFGYNLARLNLDERHPDAGFRYAEPTTPDSGDDLDVPSDWRVLRAEFTPTTEFCPQSDALTRAAFRAWNARREWHEYDLVRVRVSPLHQRAPAVNDSLAALEREFVATGDVPDDPDRSTPGGETADDASEGNDGGVGLPF